MQFIMGARKTSSTELLSARYRNDHLWVTVTTYHWYIHGMENSSSWHEGRKPPFYSNSPNFLTLPWGLRSYLTLNTNMLVVVFGWHLVLAVLFLPTVLNFHLLTTISMHFASHCWACSYSVCVNKLYTEWRKGLRRIWNLPSDAHCDIVTGLSGGMSMLDELCMRSL